MSTRESRRQRDRRDLDEASIAIRQLVGGLGGLVVPIGNQASKAVSDKFANCCDLADRANSLLTAVLRRWETQLLDEAERRETRASLTKPR